VLHKNQDKDDFRHGHRELLWNESAGEIPAVLRNRLKMWHCKQRENFDYLFVDDSKLIPDYHHTCCSYAASLIDLKSISNCCLHHLHMPCNP
jgi:hypothetical protein